MTQKPRKRQIKNREEPPPPQMFTFLIPNAQRINLYMLYLFWAAMSAILRSSIIRHLYFTRKVL